jgi:hypothetical protein
VADTYNSKIKTIDLATGRSDDFSRRHPEGWQRAMFNEPAGLSFWATLYVADTNAHRIRVINMKTKEIKTLELKSVPPVEKTK